MNKEKFNMNKFEIKVEGKKEFAVFEDGDKKLIHNDEKYGKFIYVDNKLNTDDEEPFNRFFTGRIKDAVETIRNGDGDCIQVNKMLVKTVKVIHLLDREIGEKLRKKSIEGWKDSNFGWIITCGNKTSFSGYYPLADGYVSCSPFDKDTEPLIFNKHDKAVEYIEKMISTAKEYVAEYASKVKSIKDIKDREELCIDMINRMEKDFGKFTMLEYFALDMIDDNMVPKNNYELDEYGYKIEQYCINNENTVSKKSM